MTIDPNKPIILLCITKLTCLSVLRSGNMIRLQYIMYTCVLLRITHISSNLL